MQKKVTLKVLPSEIDDEEAKPLLGEVNAVLLDLDLAGKHDAKPTHEEL